MVGRTSRPAAYSYKRVRDGRRGGVIKGMRNLPWPRPLVTWHPKGQMRQSYCRTNHQSGEGQKVAIPGQSFFIFPEPEKELTYMCIGKIRPPVRPQLSHRNRECSVDGI